MVHCANRMRCVCVTATVWVSLLMLPAIVWAQATMTGTAKDTSGALLPGVTVEATSPALIERVRSVVTDGTGRYSTVGPISVSFPARAILMLQVQSVISHYVFHSAVGYECGVSAGNFNVTYTTPGRP